MPSTSTLGGLGETRSVLRWTAVSTVCNFALCFALIPSFGMVGAAVAWSVARLVFPALCLVQIYVQHGVTPFRSHFNRPFAVTAVICAALSTSCSATPECWNPPHGRHPADRLRGGDSLTGASTGDIFVARAAERRFAVVAPVRRILERRAAPGLLDGGDWLAGGCCAASPSPQRDSVGSAATWNPYLDFLYMPSNIVEGSDG